MLFHSPLLAVVSSMAVVLCLPLTFQAQQHSQLTDPSGRLLEADPSTLETILASVNLYKEECSSKDTASCDKAANLARKGLALTRPNQISEADWQKAIHKAFPAFHSAIAQDDMLSKLDYKDAELQYSTELKLLSEEESRTRGLDDTLQLANAYGQPGDAQDLVKAVWFYARAWNFSAPSDKAKVEPALRHYYRKHHGNYDGVEDVKQLAANSIFPPNSFTISPAPSVADILHDYLLGEEAGAWSVSDPFGPGEVLAMGYKEDADKVWAARFQGKTTVVPGIVIAVRADQIQVAVSDDAIQARVADFLVTMKNPLTEAQLKVIQPGYQFKDPPDQSLKATYDSYKQIPASDKQSASAEIVLKDGVVVPAQAKAVPQHRVLHTP